MFLTMIRHAVDTNTPRTPRRSFVTGLVPGIHVVPASVVLRMVPENPTAHAVVSSMIWMPGSSTLTPEVSESHELPPSVVLKSTPCCPDAMPTNRLRK